MKFGNVTFVRGKRGGKYPYCNSLIVEDAKTAVVDTGAGREPLAAALGERKVDVIVSSHFHEDHNTCNNQYPEAELWIHREDAPPLADIEEYFNYAFPMPPEIRGFWQPHILRRHNYAGRAAQRLLEDGDILNFGETTARVIHTPGHTPGHIAIHFIEADLLYLSDIDLCDFGPWYGDRRSDLDATEASIRRVRGIGAAHNVVGHEGGPYDDITELCDKYLATISRRENGVIDAIRKGPITLDDLCGQWIIYGKPREPLDYYKLSELAVVAKHVERLERNGLIFRDGDLLVAAG